jgi:hypothetical protein
MAPYLATIGQFDLRRYRTAQEAFDFFYNDLPAGDPFWDVVVGDPGIPFLFDGAVYVRGAMTASRLRRS